MKKNLMNKMISSRTQKETIDKRGTWLYAGYEIAGYVTANDEFLDLRPQPQEDKQ